jgi:hypothetical protein
MFDWLLWFVVMTGQLISVGSRVVCCAHLLGRSQAVSFISAYFIDLGIALCNRDCMTPLMSGIPNHRSPKATC